MLGDDPVKAVNALRAKYAGAIAKGGSTGAFVTGWSAIDDRDLSALAAYLQQLPPVRNPVPASTFAPHGSR